MQSPNPALQALLATGRQQGYLTSAQCNDHLPDNSPDAVDELLRLLEGGFLCAWL